jgi:RNA polymerase sigma-70 factor, ECF subfamily
MIRLSIKNYAAQSDEELMTLIQRKDEKAFEELYARYAKKMFAYFYRMLNRSRDTANDFLQDLFLKIVEKPDSFDQAKKFSTWFYTLAANMCKNEYKKLSVRDNTVRLTARTEIAFMEDRHNELDLVSFTEELYNKLGEMDDKHKSAFILRFANNLDIKEIAEIEQCPEGTVKSRIFYTVKHLSKKLTAYKPGVE